jgi:hypothetical protein
VNARNAVLYIGGALVLLAVIGAIYLEIIVQSRSTHDVWMVTQDVPAGAQFTTDNVRQVSLPDTGDQLSYDRDDPIKAHQRAGRTLHAGHMLADDDLLGRAMVLVPVSFKAAPPLKNGDLIDVYTQFGTRTVQVGKSLTVESPNTIWVPAVDEPSWVTLQANSAPLFAVTSSGIGVPVTSGLGLPDAVSSLAGSVAGGDSGSTVVPPAPVVAVPTPTPAPTPTPRPSPTR